MVAAHRSVLVDAAVGVLISINIMTADNSRYRFAHGQDSIVSYDCGEMGGIEGCALGGLLHVIGAEGSLTLAGSAIIGAGKHNGMYRQ